MKMNMRLFVRCGMLTALAAVLTMFPQLRTPVGGYVHFGDSVIYIASIFFGPVAGAVVGALGHSLADLLSGCPQFCIPTFIIKGSMGYLIGKIAYSRLDAKRFIIAGIAALLIVTFGYFIAETIMFGMGAALFVFISSPIQWLMSIAASAALIPIFAQINKQLNNRF